MNVLIYYQNSSRTVFLESLAQSLVEKGHTVFFLTTSPEGILHEKMRDIGVTASAHAEKENLFPRFFRLLWYLLRYCRKNKIDVVLSHLQFANLVAVAAQYLIKAKVFPCRHHVDEVALLGNRNGLLGDKLVNRFARKVIVVSNAAKRRMTEHEKVKADKVVVIPLGYNFSRYDTPDRKRVAEIRKKMQCHLLLIVIARMAPNKRHIVALQVLNKLIRDGLDVKILLLDHGPEKENLEAFIAENGLEGKVFFTGFLNNTMDYVAAADLVLHPSVIEASNQIVKEAALLGKPAVVCRGIGDFDEYFIHRQNGLLVSKENTGEEMYALVKEYYNKKEELAAMGERMKKVVLNRFDVRNISEAYNRLVG